ncbi:MAG: aminodeoxychorismate/anthranilate synthase component II [Deltaproteobacteria bacterium]|nr:aminodeoxychorismate/anthranilate synthase component II [Deltaproteobacteria bacterium]
MNKTRIAFIENHDSFSHNIVDYLRRITPEVIVFDHAQTPCLEQVSHLVLGPGPGTPRESGRLMNWLESAIESSLPILGICLGHQALGEFFGSSLSRAKQAVHGEVHMICHTGERLFKGFFESTTRVTRYHSLVLEETPKDFIRDAWTKSGEIMAISHQTKPIFGIQFHPESFLSEHGLLMLQNFLKYG